MTNETIARFCATCGASLTAGAEFCPACGKPAVRPSAAAPAPSTIFHRLAASLEGRYSVQRELGKGGMATVYLAHDVRHERDVAIKVLHPELAATVGAERFEREIKVAAKLQHPNILTLYDSGEADGLLFYVMPFVQGESLRDRLDRDEMLPVDEAVGLTLEVAEALGHAHSLGVVHRDIKPENILLSNGHALVADFGIARALSEAGDRKLTQTGTAVGTPLYMSPEQALGDEVGPSSDLYSLACVCYELLTGQPPFTGNSARAIMARHTMEMVPSVRVVRDAVPEEIEAALMWALAKVPADRPQNAAALAEALGSPLGAAAARRGATRARMTTPRLTGMVRARPEWYRRPAVMAAAGVGALALIVAVMLPRGGSGAESDLDPHNLAVLYFEDGSPDGSLAYLADGLTDGLRGALGGVRALQVVSRNGSELARTIMREGASLDSVARALGAGMLVSGRVEPAGSDVRVNLRLVDGYGVDVPRSRASIQMPAADPLALRDSLVAEAARLVRAQLGQEIQTQRQLAGTTNREAWVLVQRGERLLRQMDSGATAGDTLLVQRRFAESDSLLTRAETVDARWALPVVLRATLAYRRSRYVPDDPGAAGRWITAGLGHVERALTVERENTDALEVRGNLRYWSWLLGLEPDEQRARRLLESARDDLVRATTLSPAQAGAYATLSHLYNQTDAGTQVILAAQQALAADAFLANADVILQRLFFATYDEGQFQNAEGACREGVRRFPSDPRFAECRLWLLTQPRLPEYDVTRAHRLADSVVALSAPWDTAYRAASSRLAVAAVLTRAGQPDSARAVVQRSLGDPIIDPTRDLANMAAFVYTLLRDYDAAIAQLRIYLTAQPHRRAAYATDAGWWFRDLVNHPGYVQLTAGAR